MVLKSIYFTFLMLFVNQTVFGYNIKINGSSSNINGITAIDKESQKIAIFLQQELELVINKKLLITNSNSENKILLQIGSKGMTSNLFANCEQDAYYFGVKGSNFLILGNSKVGLEFGVYDFIEKYLGITWLMPTEIGKYIPKQKDIVLSKSAKLNNPIFKSRQLSPLNYYGEGPLNDWAKYSKIFSSISFHHNMNFFIKNININNLDVEIFPSYSGRRYIPRNSDDHNWQPNFKSKKFLDYSLTKVSDYFKNSKSKTFSLGINDNFLVSDDMKGAVNKMGYTSYSEDYYKWVNNLVGELNKTFPNKKYGLLAYYNVSNPPSFKLQENVVPFITFERLKWRNPEEMKKDKALTEEWSYKTNEIGWYDYQYGLTYMIPRVYSQLIKDYLLWACENGVKYYYAELYPNWGEGPKSWILSKLLWNPNQDLDELQNEWYNKAVGQASASYLKAYFAIWENYWTIELKNDQWLTKQKTFLPYNDLGYLKNITNQMVATSQKQLELMIKNVSSKSEKERAQAIMDMWVLYKIVIQEYKTGKFPNFNSLKKSSSFIKQLNILSDNELHKPIVQVLRNNLK